MQDCPLKQLHWALLSLFSLHLSSLSVGERRLLGLVYRNRLVERQCFPCLQQDHLGSRPRNWSSPTEALWMAHLLEILTVQFWSVL